MERQDFVDLLIDHYENPRKRGAVDNATVVMNGGNPACGDVLTLYVTIDAQTERVTDIHFEGDGCTISPAGASLMTEEMAGKTVSEVEQIGYDVVVNLMGRDVVATRLRCATLGLSTLKAAVKKYRGTPVPLLPCSTTTSVVCCVVAMRRATKQTPTQ